MQTALAQCAQELALKDLPRAQLIDTKGNLVSRELGVKRSTREVTLSKSSRKGLSRMRLRKTSFLHCKRGSNAQLHYALQGICL